ncbi:hypothetical protein [Polaromonas aquatica]|uniref:Glycosyltransferase RgtA/B/C/D-like domain-containing protein n=2 Tax=Polaromonas TaxID=52972 RepID=A0ABW1U1Y7_9BURK
MPHFFSIFFPLALLSISCVGAGLLILSFLSTRPRENNLIEYAVAFVLGQGVLGSLFLLPALMGWFTKPALLVVIMPLALLGAWKVGLSSQAISVAMRKHLLAYYKAPFIWQLLTFFATLLLLSGATAVAGRIDGDARAFYLALPKVIATSHRLLPLPGYEGFSSVGLLAEMQLAALFLLDMPGASPRLFSWVSGLAGAVLLAAIARKAGLGRRGQLLSVIMLLTSSAVAYFWGQGKTDLFAVVFALAGVLFALERLDGVASRKSAVLLAGVFTGFALVAKLSYIVAFLPTIFVLLFWRDIHSYWPNRRMAGAAQKLLKECSGDALIFTGALLIPLVPHLLKNYILLNTLVDTYGSHHYFSDETTRRIILTYPLWPFFGSFWGQYGNLSPLVLAFLPVLIWVLWKDRRWNAPVIAIIVAAATGLLAWIILFPSVPMPRYFLATLLLLIIPVAWAMERVSYADRWLNYGVVLAAFACILIFGKSWDKEIFRVAAAYEYLLGDQSEKNLHIDEVLSRNVYEAINQSAEPGARIYLGSFYRFWLRPDLIQCVNGKTDGEISFDAENPGKFWLQVYEHGFSYLFMDQTYPTFPALKNAPDWVHIEMIYPQSGYGGAYRLRYVNPPTKVRLATKEVSSGAWDVVPVQ